MANYESLKSAIQQVVRTNGNEEITGALLQQTLFAMVNSLGAGYQFAGVATPSTNPGTPDQNVWYIATESGAYPNFGGLFVNDGDVCALCWNGTWTKMVSGAATKNAVVQLNRELIGGTKTVQLVSDNWEGLMFYSDEVGFVPSASYNPNRNGWTVELVPGDIYRYQLSPLIRVVLLTERPYSGYVPQQKQINDSGEFTADSTYKYAYFEINIEIGTSASYTQESPEGLKGRVEDIEEQISDINEQVSDVKAEVGSAAEKLSLSTLAGICWFGYVGYAAGSYDGILLELTEGVQYEIKSPSNTRLIFGEYPQVGATTYIREVDANAPFIVQPGEKYLLITVYTSDTSQVPQVIERSASGLYAAIAGVENVKSWTSDDGANAHIEELYINPSFFVAGMRISTLVVRANDINIAIANSSGTIVANFSAGWSQPQSYPIPPLGELIFPLTRSSDMVRIGYVKLKYSGVDYGVSSVVFQLNESLVTDVDNSSEIKEVINSENEGLLLGDSLISYPEVSRQVITAYLTHRLKMQIWDAGCGGCTMAYRTPGGTDFYDSFSFAKLADLFVSGVKDANQQSPQDYGLAIANLLSVDKTKRLFILNEYGLNDFNTPAILKGAAPVADSSFDADSLDRTTLLGAMSYGIAKILTSKPDVHYCQVTTPYVVYNGVGYGDMSDTEKGQFGEWCDSICENAIKMGVPYVQAVNQDTGRNFIANRISNFNTVDGNHTNEYGAFRFAEALAHIFESMM